MSKYEKFSKNSVVQSWLQNESESAKQYVSGVGLPEYVNQLLQRYSNPDALLNAAKTNPKLVQDVMDLKKVMEDIKKQKIQEANKNGNTSLSV
jgi:hypothetical protein